MYDAMDIAEYVLWYCDSVLKKPITNLKLQKFLYYMQGANMVMNNAPLFDNSIEAWKYGPVVPDVYYWYNDNLGSPIMGVERRNINFYLEEAEVIESVIKTLIDVDVWHIVNETHKDAPWLEHKDTSGEIPVRDINNWFTDNWGIIWNAYQ